MIRAPRVGSRPGLGTVRDQDERAEFGSFRAADLNYSVLCVVRPPSADSGRPEVRSLHAQLPVGRAARVGHFCILRRYRHQRPRPWAVPTARPAPRTVPSTTWAPTQASTAHAPGATNAAWDQVVPEVRRRGVRLLMGQAWDVQRQNDQELRQLLRLLLLRPGWPRGQQHQQYHRWLSLIARRI